MKKALALAFAVGLFITPRAMAELKVGDDAPSIHIKEWVKGEAFDLSKAKEKDVVVVEFWATWCGPCRASIPHMSEMQEHFEKKGVTFIGVTDEDRKIVDKFLKSGWDEKMRYRVAIDKDDKTSEAYMKASGQQGIPTAFVLQGGKLRWIGHPMMGLDLQVAKLTGDTEYAKKAEEEQKRRDKIQELMKKFQMAAMAEDWKKAITHLDAIMEVDDTDFRAIMTKYHLLVAKLDKPDEAKTFGRANLIKSNNENELNAAAWTILTADEFDGKRDLELAKQLAAKAMKVSDEKDPSVIDTYARALADTGDLNGAIEWQTKAVELAEGQLKVELRENLNKFKERLKDEA